MRVQDFIKKNVVFIGAETNGRFVPYGTGWWAYQAVYDLGFTFLVTANHVVGDIPGDSISIRVNRKEGGCDVLRIPKTQAILHPNSGNDIALLCYPIDTNIYDISITVLDRAQQEHQYETKQQPHTGDEVCAVGLYTSHYGAAKNIPVVRIGHIAAIPDEDVQTEFGSAQGYLVEIKSIAGLSGSPVFITVPPVRIHNGALQSLNHDAAYIGIGTLVGYHIVQTREDQISVPKFQGDDLPEESKTGADERNTGFAVVIPIERLFEILEAPNIMKGLEAEVEREKKKLHHPSSASHSEVALSSTIESVQSASAKHNEDFAFLQNASENMKP